jgi:hypothetical protein
VVITVVIAFGFSCCQRKVSLNYGWRCQQGNQGRTQSCIETWVELEYFPVPTKHKSHYIMNLKITLLGPSIAGVVALLTGCESSQPTQPLSSYQRPYYQGAQPYRYPQQQISQGPSATTQSAPPPASPPPNSAQAQPGSADVAAAVHPETIPSSPGPDYVWMPSYWTIGVSGGWVWVGGHYVLRQGASEEQLRAARGMLEQARMELSGSKAKSINKAIEEINEALSR